MKVRTFLEFFPHHAFTLKQQRDQFGVIVHGTRKVVSCFCEVSRPQSVFVTERTNCRFDFDFVSKVNSV